jgi:TfoX/Sxy family transcriptional regulator of competence genes
MALFMHYRLLTDSQLVVIWVAGVFIIRMRDRRELRRAIDELNNIEKANG